MLVLSIAEGALLFAEKTGRKPPPMPSSESKKMLKSPMLSVGNSKKSKTIKVLMLLWRGETDAERGFLEKLRELDYEVEKTVLDGKCNLKVFKQTLYTEFKSQDYDYIYTFGTLVSLVAVEWAHGGTPSATPPIVFNAVSDPFRVGLANLRVNDGHNLSGVATSIPAEKQLENAQSFLKIEHLFVLVCSREQNCLGGFEAIEAVAKAKKIPLSRVDVTSVEELGVQLERLAKERSLKNRVLYVPSSSFFTEHKQTIFERAIAMGIPTIVEQRDMVEAGALMGTTVSYESAGQLAAEIINMNHCFRVPVAAIPVQYPESLCQINRNTAEALDISIDGTGVEVDWINASQTAPLE
jgi:putative ABC transport system substrate-binding protein